jgi:hypothetical protein
MKFNGFAEVRLSERYVKDTEFAIAGFPYDWGSITHYEVYRIDAPDMKPKVSNI